MNTDNFTQFTSNSLAEIIDSAYDGLKEYTRDALVHFLLFAVFYVVSCMLLYTCIMRWKLIGFEKAVQGPRSVLIVIAHPDDECMFFGPTIVNLVQRKNCRVHLMCLSTGANYGMDVTRKRELYKSCNVLGIHENNIVVHSHTNLPDSMKVRWPVDLVGHLILNHVETYEIDTVITFDKHGISKHLNHCSIYYAIAYLITEKKLPKYCSVYVLESINMLRKYWMIFDIPLCFLLSNHRYILSFINGSLIKRAMKQHESQLVWFRQLYLLFSRYILINTLQKMELMDIELDLEIDD